MKEYTSEHAQHKVEYYLGLTPKNKQSFQGLIDHLSLAFQSCEMVSSLIGDIYNQSQNTRVNKDVFANELQILLWKILACKPEFLGEANQTLKHQFAHNLRDLYFGVVARGQCLASPDSESFTQFRGWLAMMFGCQEKYVKQSIQHLQQRVARQLVGSHTRINNCPATLTGVKVRLIHKALRLVQ